MQVNVANPPKQPPTPPLHIEHDGYQAQFLPESGPEGLMTFHFVVKRTYDIRPDDLATPARIQNRLNLSDRYYDEAQPMGSAVRYETDLLPPKPSCDVIINGHCYPPGGEAIQAECGVDLGKRRKRLRIIGDRSFYLAAGATRAEITPARPFSVMPIRWEYAYGGMDQQHPMGPIPFAANPTGCGFRVADVPGSPSPHRWGPLPNIEDADLPIRLDQLLVPADQLAFAPRPAGLGVIPKHWEPRASSAGLPKEMQDIWEMLHGKPLADPDAETQTLPFKSMQPRFYQAAPEGQVVPHPRGGETIVLHGLHPETQELRLRLPVDKPRLSFSTGGEFTPVEVKTDTVIIEPDLMRLDLIWRGSLPAPDDVSLDKLTEANMKVDGELILPAALLGTGFPIELLVK